VVTKSEVLKFICARTGEKKSTSYRTLVREFPDLSEEAACDHLKRLWDQRLIEPTDSREPQFGFRLKPGESLRELRFEITARGRARLRWWKERDREREESW
jgi:hypothetical protein